MVYNKHEKRLPADGRPRSSQKVMTVSLGRGRSFLFVIITECQNKRSKADQDQHKLEQFRQCYVIHTHPPPFARSEGKEPSVENEQRATAYRMW